MLGRDWFQSIAKLLEGNRTLRATEASMQKIKNLSGECQHCGGPIQFHAEHIGGVADCPHCGQSTELTLPAPPPDRSPVPVKAIIFVTLAIVILGAGMVGINQALKRARQMQATQNPAPAPTQFKATGPFASQEFQASPVVVTQMPGRTIVYAVGTITNFAARPRFEVKVELDLFDESGGRLGVASDYQKLIDPGDHWDFKALVVDKRTRTAQLTAIREAR
jgi:hypothetical protein